jgi:hypothetical protein
MENMESMKTLARASKQRNRLSARKLKIGREAAEIAANHFILEHLPDRYCAGNPYLVEFPIRTVWSVPIMLGYPQLGVIGQVGTVIIDSEMGTVAGWTPLQEVRTAARELYEQRKTEIEAPVV